MPKRWVVPKASYLQRDKSWQNTVRRIFTTAYKTGKKTGLSKRGLRVASDPFQTKLLRRFIRKKVDPPMYRSFHL